MTELDADEPDNGDVSSGPLDALLHLDRGDWQRAHELVQRDDSREAAWVHAHLHRVEGDADNAAYWHGVARQPVPRDGLDVERERIRQALMAQRRVTR